METFTGKHPYTELKSDIENATVDELDEMLSVYRCAWTDTEILNDCFVIKGTKDNSCLDINSTTNKMQLNYDTTDLLWVLHQHIIYN